MGANTSKEKYKSRITREQEFCLVCGCRKENDHHLLFGMGRRKIGAEDDRLTIPLCALCHTGGKQRLHDHPTAEYLSKLAGQLAWEREHLVETFPEDMREEISERTRDAFITRYGKSWI